MRRALHVEHRVADLLPQSRELLLELRLVVDVRRGRVFDSRTEGFDNRPLDRLEAVLEKERGQGGLEQRGENVAVPGEAAELLVGDDAFALLDQLLAEPELTRDDGAARARDDVRANLRQLPLRQVGVPLVERPGDGQLQDAVAEELEAFVGGRAVGRPRGVREGVVRPFGGQLFDQPREAAGGAVRRLATGAR